MKTSSEAGQPEATDTERRLEEVLAAHGGSLRRIARVYAGGEREDLHQEILCQLWRSLPSFRGDAGLGTWVYRVALNTALTHRRRAWRRGRFEARGGPPEGCQPSSAGDPKDEDAILRDFLGSLGAIDRSVLVLYMEGLSHEQIADVTGLTAGAVAVRLHRQKQAFRRRYVER